MISLDAVGFLVDYDGLLLDLCGDTSKSGLHFEGFKWGGLELTRDDAH